MWEWKVSARRTRVFNAGNRHILQCSTTAEELEFVVSQLDDRSVACSVEWVCVRRVPVWEWRRWRSRCGCGRRRRAAGVRSASWMNRTAWELSVLPFLQLCRTLITLIIRARVIIIIILIWVVEHHKSAFSVVLCCCSNEVCNGDAAVARWVGPHLREEMHCQWLIKIKRMVILIRVFFVVVVHSISIMVVLVVSSRKNEEMRSLAVHFRGCPAHSLENFTNFCYWVERHRERERCKNIQYEMKLED